MEEIHGAEAIVIFAATGKEKLTGHKTESVYRRYAIVNDADLREATQRLPARFRARRGPRALTVDP